MGWVKNNSGLLMKIGICVMAAGIAATLVLCILDLVQ